MRAARTPKNPTPMQPPRPGERPIDRAARTLVAGLVERRLLELEAAGLVECVEKDGVVGWRKKGGAQ